MTVRFSQDAFDDGPEPMATGVVLPPPYGHQNVPRETLAPGARFHGQVSPGATLKFYFGVSKGFGKDQHG